MANNRRTLKFEDFSVQVQNSAGAVLNIYKASGFKRDKPAKWRGDDLYVETQDTAYLDLPDTLPDNVAVSVNGEPATGGRVQLKGSNSIKVRVKTDNGGNEYHINLHTVKVPARHKAGRPNKVRYNEEDDCFFFEDALWWMFWIDAFYYDDPYFYEEEMYWEPEDQWVGEFEEFNNFDEEFPVDPNAPEPQNWHDEAEQAEPQAEAEDLSVSASEPEPEYRAPEPAYEPPTERYEPPAPSYDPPADTGGGWGSSDSGGSSDFGGGGDSGGFD